MSSYSPLQLDAFRELANIGSGTAATALSSLLERPVGVSVPTAAVLPLADAVDSTAPAGERVTGIAVRLQGDIEASALLLLRDRDTATVCGLLGVDADSEVGRSALGEVGNILASSYVGALVQMTGLALEPRPPETSRDVPRAFVSRVLATSADALDLAFVLDSELSLAGVDCCFSFIFVPTASGAGELLARLGLAD